MKTTNNNHNEFAQMGIAALLPGMQYMLDLMQQALSEKRDLLTALQDGIGEVSQQKRIGRPPGAKNKRANGWPADPEERKAEMARRQKVAAAKRGEKLHPRDPGHPDHAKWVASIGKRTKKAWAAMSPAKRKARLVAMAAGRARAKGQSQPVVQMEKTA